MARSAGYVSAEYLRKVAALGRQIKQRSYELMALSAGARALDVGCGPGLDTVAMAPMVGPTGSIVGVDIDEEMLQQADAAAHEAGVAGWVQHWQGDVAALPFDDASFDACHAERLLQVLPASYRREAVFAEMLRVLRPGGRLVVADTDWATASVDFSDAELERRLMAFFASSLRPNGYAGRQLYALYRQHGLVDVAVEVFPLLQTDFSQSPFGNWLVSEALAAGVASQAALDGWMRELQARQEAGTFSWCVNLVLVSGVKP